VVDELQLPTYLTMLRAKPIRPGRLSYLAEHGSYTSRDQNRKTSKHGLIAFLIPTVTA